MSAQTTIRAIEVLGWTPDTDSTIPAAYRAVQNGFSTPWRASFDEVLTDVAQLRSKADKGQISVASPKGRW